MILGHTTLSIQPMGLTPEPGSLYFCFQPGRVLLAQKEGEPALPHFAQVQPLLSQGVQHLELGHTAHHSIFCPNPLAEIGDIPEGNGLVWQSIGAFHSMSFANGAVLTSAWHLWSWYRSNRFCGACGQPMTASTQERALCCPGCGAIRFPMIAPAVIVAITCGDEILLARNVKSELNHYALVAGYVEVGETLEHAVQREVKEEVGLDITDLHYIGDQPWGISGSLMFAFHAHADRNAPLTLQQSEIAHAKWVSREALTPTIHPVSLAFELIERFRTGTL